MTWLELYEQARTHRETAAGYYNDNIRIGEVIVRIPIHGADIMDLRLWREEDVLTAIAPYVEHAPRLHFTSAEPPFQIHGFIPGDVLNDIAPRGVPIPAHVPGDVVDLFVQLTQVPRAKLPATPEDWPADGDSTGFGERLTTLTQWVYDTYRDDYADLYAAFGVPTDPLAVLTEVWPRLTARPSVCVHADVHRKNMIVQDGTSAFLDWELALWGDPVYDLAVHFHKMEYLPPERDAVLTRWLAAMPVEHTAGWEHDLDAYLAHERIKSAIVDTVRYSQTFANGGPYPYPPDQMVVMMAAKLNRARKPWGLEPNIHPKTVKTAFETRSTTPRSQL
ncbi:aminoglycoside phosphotransferase family protein [Spirillospora sp. NPDC047279]|uniref:phosphotransferase family protein n=1 Tax=Spirillospora sp. NPDC047279 TaxID=3155478 RepID=UPI0033DDF9B2